jgi:hypothetical protein
MTDPAVLRRVQHGRTQNANECVNGQIWSRCPKTIHVGVDRIKTAVASAVCHFNKGSGHMADVLTNLGAKAARSLRAYGTSQDFQRVQRAKHDSLPAVKRARKGIVKARKAATVNQERREGETYGLEC